jgi:transposase
MLRGCHMADLFTVTVRPSRHRLPRLSVRFREKAYRHLAATLLGKTIIFTDRTDWSDEQIVLAYRAQHCT